MTRLLAILALVALSGCTNFGVVEPQRVFRCAQPDAADLIRWRELHGIRSVLNLRGESDEPWFREESAACAALELEHHSVPWRADSWPRPEDLERVVACLEDGPFPLLIHCKAGADRTGLASALYRLSRGEPTARARDELSLRYFHVPWFGGTWAMDALVTQYDKSRGGRNLRAWVREVYPALYAARAAR